MRAENRFPLFLIPLEFLHEMKSLIIPNDPIGGDEASADREPHEMRVGPRANFGLDLIVIVLNRL